MKNYRVVVPYVCWITAEIQANSPESAANMAYEECLLSSYCGNGGTDKLIGVSGSNLSIEAGEDPITGSINLDIDVEEI